MCYCVRAMCTYYMYVHVRMCLKQLMYKLAEEGEGERLTERGGLGGPGHRWLWEADVPAELFRQSLPAQKR